MKNSLVLFYFLLLIIPGLSHAGLYQCKNAQGHVEFKDKPCSGTQKTEATYTITKTKGPSCNDMCDKDKWICISGQAGNDQVVNACNNNWQLCRVGCNNPQRASQIQQQQQRERQSYTDKARQERRMRELESRVNEVEAWQD